MKVCLGVTSGMQFGEIMRLSEHAQEHGLHSVWVGDDINRPHDVFVVVSSILLRAPKMKVGIGITSPLVRNISTMARASAALDETGGSERFRLGLGIGGLQDLQKLGKTVEKPRELLHDATILLRKMWTHKMLSFQKESFALRGHRTNYGSGSTMPILFGVRGPKMLRLAGQIADGVILSGPKTYLRKTVKLVKASIGSSEQPTRKFRFVAWVPTMLVENPNELDYLRRTVAFVLADTPSQVLEMAELDHEQAAKLKEVYRSSGALKAASLVTEDLAEEMAVYGAAAQICDSFKLLEKHGFHEAVFGPPFGVDNERAVVELARAWRQLT